MNTLNIPTVPPTDDRRQLAQQLADGKTEAWQLLTSQPEADLNPLEWAQLAQVARRQQIALPEIRTIATVERRYRERQEPALIADPDRCALAYRSNRTWYIMSPAGPTTAPSPTTEAASWAPGPWPRSPSPH